MQLFQTARRQSLLVLRRNGKHNERVSRRSADSRNEPHQTMSSRMNLGDGSHCEMINLKLPKILALLFATRGLNFHRGEPGESAP